MDFFIENGRVISTKEANLGIFLLEDSFVFSQKVWFGHGGIPLLNENIESIRLQLQLLGAELPGLFCNYRELFRLCKRMLNKNKFYQSGHILFRFFISDKNVDFVVTCQNYSGFDFPMKGEGILVNFADYTKNSQSQLSVFPCYNQNLWKAAIARIRKSAFQNSIFLNEYGKVCDGIFSNLFFIKGNTLYTPSIKTGCFCDIIRKIILQEAATLQLEIVESSEIDAEQLMDADELFFAGEARGFEWILGIENKRFLHNVSIILHERVNQHLKRFV